MLFVALLSAVAVVAMVCLAVQDGPEPGRRKWTRALCICAIGSLAAYACLLALRESNAIRSRGKTVDAVLDEARAIKRRGTVRQVKYHFQLEPSGPVYSALDELRRPNAWADLEREAAEKAGQTRRVPVIYDPENPWTNIPRPLRHKPVLPTLTWLCFGGAVAAFSLLFLAIVVFELRLTQG